MTTEAAGGVVVAAYSAGRGRTGGGTDAGWATSLDGGVTWTHGFLPGITAAASPPGPYLRAEDTTVAFDAAHNVWLIEASGTVGSGDSWRHVALVVNRSSDGINWSLPSTVVASGGPDQGWITCDNGANSRFRGHCYVLWSDTNTSTGGPFLASVSTDGGVTWSAPRAPAGGPIGYSVQPLVQPDGTVVVVATGANSMNQIVMFRSTDGGATWTDPVPWLVVQHHAARGAVREFPRPSAAVDASGAVYLVWADCRYRPGCAQNDVIIAVSRDGVAAPTVVRAVGVKGDAILPAAGVDPTTSGEHARLGVVYYVVDPTCQSATDCPFDARVATSSNGGASWAASSKLATGASFSWLPSTVIGRLIGDYSHIPVLPAGPAVPVYVYPRRPDSAFHSDLYAARADVVRSPTPRLTAHVTASGRATLSAVSGRPGTYAITVVDLSRSSGFRLQGPGVNRRTSPRFTGTTRWTVHLGPGTYRFGARGGLSGQLIVG